MKLINKEEKTCTVFCDCESCDFSMEIRSLDAATIKDALIEDGWTLRKIKGFDKVFCSSVCFSEWKELNDNK